MTEGSTVQPKHKGLWLVSGPSTEAKFYARFLTFCTIEGAFIGLAIKCLIHPTPLDLFPRFSDAEVAHGFTIISIIWQTLAVIAAERIITEAFSREWTAQQGDIRLKTADRVSVITSGFLDHTTHLSFKRSSRTFKFAFLASLTLLVLTKLAPGTISTDHSLVDVPTQIQVGTLIKSVKEGDIFNPDISSKITRVRRIVDLEQNEHLPFGLKLQRNLLVFYPVVDLGLLERTVEYDSDVVEYHYDCYWEAPRFISNGSTIIAGGRGWSPQVSMKVPSNLGAFVVVTLSPTTLEELDTTNTTAFLVIKGNDTFFTNQVTPPHPVTSSIVVNMFEDAFAGSLASVFICDPHLQISGGRARLFVDGSLRVISSGGPRIGNFPESAANLIFTTACFETALEVQPSAPAQRNLIGGSVMSTIFATNLNDTKTLSKNMDAFMNSAAKAYLDGYRSPSSTGKKMPPNVTTIPATRQESHLVLVASKGLVVTVTVLFVLTVVLLFVLCRSVLTKETHPFNLDGVLTVLQLTGGKLLMDFDGLEIEQILDEE